MRYLELNQGVGAPRGFREPPAALKGRLSPDDCENVPGLEQNVERIAGRRLPENCRNQSGIVVTCCDNLSTGVSSFSITNSYLKTP